MCVWRFKFILYKYHRYKMRFLVTNVTKKSWYILRIKRLNDDIGGGACFCARGNCIVRCIKHVAHLALSSCAGCEATWHDASILPMAYKREQGSDYVACRIREEAVRLVDNFTWWKYSRGETISHTHSEYPKRTGRISASFRSYFLSLVLFILLSFRSLLKCSLLLSFALSVVLFCFSFLDSFIYLIYLIYCLWCFFQSYFNSKYALFFLFICYYFIFFYVTRIFLIIKKIYFRFFFVNFIREYFQWASMHIISSIIFLL